LFVSAFVSGCALVDAEKNNRGGFLDEIADDHWMKADSKKMRALRALTLETSLARVAMIAPKSAPDRALLARRIGETTKRAEVVRKCAFGEQLSIVGRRPDEPCFFFDSVIVDYENALFDLALVALPLDDAKKLISRVSGGIASISVNPLELIQALVDIGREAFRYGRVVGAIYRDTLELEVQVWLASPDFAASERSRGQPEEFIVTNDRVAGLRAVYVRGNDNIPAWRAAIMALRAEGLEPVPDQRFIAELYSILGYICGQIVNESDPAFGECRQQRIMQSIPIAAGPGGNVFGAGPGRSGGGGAGAGASGGGQVSERTRRLAANDAEARVPGSELQAMKRALCVAGLDTSTDVFDDQTRNAVQQFAGGILWKAPPAESPPITGSTRTDLKRAAKLFPDCGSVVANPYELGVYSRGQTAEAGIASVNQVLSRAVFKVAPENGPNVVGRAAILILRDKLSPTPPSGVTRDALDGALWLLIQQKGVAVDPALPGSGAKR
jgi:hypothetical protein